MKTIVGSVAEFNDLEIVLPTPSAVRYTSEVHRVTVWCDAGQVLGGLFQVSVVPFVGGKRYVTTPIAFDAEPMETEEALAPGSSMQAKLQALPMVGSVTASRMRNTGANGFTWFVTFNSLRGVVPRVEIVRDLNRDRKSVV